MTNVKSRAGNRIPRTHLTEFIILCLTHLEWLRTQLYSQTHSVVQALSLIIILLLVVSIAISIFKRNSKHGYPLRRIATLIFGGLLFLIPSSPNNQSIYVAVVAPTLVFTILTLAAYRLSAVWYVVLAALCAILWAAYINSLWAVFPAAAVYAVLFAGANYCVRLVLDHHQDGAKLRKQGLWRLTQSVYHAMIHWLPCLILLGIGALAHDWVERAIKTEIYSSGAILLEPNQFDPKKSPPLLAQRDLERDIRWTIGESRKEAQAAFESRLVEAEKNGVASLDATPRVIEQMFDEARPGNFDETGACQNFQLRIKFAGRKARVGSMRGACGSAFGSFENWVVGIYDGISRAAVSKSRERAEEAKGRALNERDEARRIGREEINNAFDSALLVNNRSFDLLGFAAILSIILIAMSTIASFAIILARTLFDSGIDESGVPDPESSPFSLSAETEPPASLRFELYDRLSLAVENNIRQDQHWYIVGDVARRGVGTAMNIRIPQAKRCFWQRLLNGRLLATLVAPPKNLARTQIAPRGPLASLPGDLKIVTVSVADNTELVFRWRDLSGYTSGIDFESIYSAHAGTHFLSLGNFFAVARGNGTLALRSEGAEVVTPDEGYSVPPSALLAWDRRQAFTLDQFIRRDHYLARLSAYWLNEPSLCIAGNSKAVIIDEGRRNGTGVGSRVVNLLRYIVMPF